MLVITSLFEHSNKPKLVNFGKCVCFKIIQYSGEFVLFMTGFLWNELINPNIL